MQQRGHETAGVGDGLTHAERDHTIWRIGEYLDARAVRRVADSIDPLVEEVVASANARGKARATVRPDALVEHLVLRLGRDVLANRVLRYELALAAGNQRVRNLLRYDTRANVNVAQTTKARIIAERQWRPGGPWARHFAAKLGFKPALAGELGVDRPADTEYVSPAYKLPKLEDFQIETGHAIRERLDGVPGANRAFLSLPTGAGKTRTTIDSALRWWHECDRPGVLLWIAQNEELCEQAVQSFAQTWQDHALRDPSKAPRRETLSIHRLWGRRRLDDVQAGGVVVAGIQRLAAMARRDPDDPEREALEALGEHVGLVLIDEAHHAVAPSYTRVLDALGVHVARGAASRVPVIGISATPFRANLDETRRLIQRFETKLAIPSVLGDTPIDELQRRRVLSNAKCHLLSYPHQRWRTRSVQAWREHLEQYGDLHPELIRHMAADRERNRELLRVLSGLARRKDNPTLLFAATVAHAEAMAVLLRGKGHSAACVTGETRDVVRRRIIDDFRQGRISVLCNYGVLTTGFDAPRVRSMVIARPTTSPVLYEQMVGRGMRGKKFGGTPTCDVHDVLDNLEHGSIMSWTRYQDLWRSERRRGGAAAA